MMEALKSILMSTVWPFAHVDGPAHDLPRRNLQARIGLAAELKLRSIVVAVHNAIEYAAESRASIRGGDCARTRIVSNEEANLLVVARRPSGRSGREFPSSFGWNFSYFAQLTKLSYYIWNLSL
jgi:hypothetical protein